MYQREVGVDMLNAVKSLSADVLSVSPSSEQRVVTLITLIWLSWLLGLAPAKI